MRTRIRAAAHELNCSECRVTWLPDLVHVRRGTAMEHHPSTRTRIGMAGMTTITKPKDRPCCQPPTDQPGRPEVRNRSRDGDKWVCPHGRVWELRDPSRHNPHQKAMYLVWEPIHGYQAWRARRQAKKAVSAQAEREGGPGKDREAIPANRPHTPSSAAAGPSVAPPASRNPTAAPRRPNPSVSQRDYG